MCEESENFSGSFDENLLFLEDGVLVYVCCEGLYDFIVGIVLIFNVEGLLRDLLNLLELKFFNGIDCFYYVI